MKDTIVIGKIGAPHGVKGEFKVFPITDDMSRFKDLETVYIEGKNGPEKYTAEYCKFQKSNVILKLKEVNDRDLADIFKNKYLEVDRSDAIPLNEGEYFIVDLIGLDVIENGEKIGILKDVLQYGPTDTYVIKTDKKEILVPAIGEYILEIDLEQKSIFVQIPQELKEL